MDPHPNQQQQQEVTRQKARFEPTLTSIFSGIRTQGWHFARRMLLTTVPHPPVEHMYLSKVF